jgi:hypothetical protein
MTVGEFNNLPYETRLFINQISGCFSCGGNIEEKLERGYQMYLQFKTDTMYTFKNGAVYFTDAKTKKSDILYPLLQNDTKEERIIKLKTALRIYKVRPEVFLSIDIEAIRKEIVPEIETKATEVKKNVPLKKLRKK